MTFEEETKSHIFGNLWQHFNVGIFTAKSDDHAEGQIRNLKFIHKDPGARQLIDIYSNDIFYRVRIPSKNLEENKILAKRI